MRAVILILILLMWVRSRWSPPASSTSIRPSCAGPGVAVGKEGVV
jgi:hypothetical protein